MRKINYHTHTQLCKHAGGTERDYVQAALERKMDILGFSDHGPYPDDRFGLRMDYAELKPHLECLRKLKEEFRDRLCIGIGLEIEYIEGEERYYEALLQELGVEYLLMGQHFFNTASKEIMNTYFIERTGDTSYYLDYAKSLAAGMRSGFFKAVAHPDLFFINDLPVDKNCEEACDIIIDAAAVTNTVLELNANGLRRQKKQYADAMRFPYPHKMFWEKVSQTNIPVLINSDCHTPEQVWDETMEEAYKMAASWGLHPIDEMAL